MVAGGIIKGNDGRFNLTNRYVPADDGIGVL